MRALGFSIICALTLGGASAFADDVPSQTPTSKPVTIEYPTVAEALNALQSRKDAKSYTAGPGWLVFEIPSEYTIWTFVPKDNAAYPAVVKRVITRDANGVYINMDVLCEASQSACDDLVKQFNQLNDQMKQSMSHH